MPIKERDLFMIALGRECKALAPYSIRTLAVKIMAHSKAYHRLYTDETCNRPLSEQEKQRKLSAANRLLALCGPENIGVILGGDPRGCTVRLMLPSGASNDLEGKYCVPLA
jgi:hypothetical protein